MQVLSSECRPDMQSGDGTLISFLKQISQFKHTHFITFYIFSAHNNFDLYTICHFMKECLSADFTTVHIFLFGCL